MKADQQQVFLSLFEFRFMQHSSSYGNKRGSNTKEAIEYRLLCDDNTHKPGDEKNAPRGNKYITAKFLILNN
jgi:hypothetical protein